MVWRNCWGCSRLCSCHPLALCLCLLSSYKVSDYEYGFTAFVNLNNTFALHSLAPIPLSLIVSSRTHITNSRANSLPWPSPVPCGRPCRSPITRRALRPVPHSTLARWPHRLPVRAYITHCASQAGHYSALAAPRSVRSSLATGARLNQASSVASPANRSCSACAGGCRPASPSSPAAPPQAAASPLSAGP